MSKLKNLKTDFRTHDKWLAAAFALGPLSALSNLTVSYFLTPESCARGSKTLLHAVAIAFIVTSIVAAIIARRVGATFPDTDPLSERTRWQVNAATVLAVASVVLILAMEIPNFILRSCD